MKRIGILHPGEMGVSVAASAIHSGHEVYWASEDRSDATRRRAETYNLMDTISLSQLFRTCEIIICICPPHAAEDTARMALDYGFDGLYLDANAIAPQRAIRIEELLDTAGIQFVDGGIIGGPAWKPNETRLYLSGVQAHEVAACFSQGPLETQIIGNKIGKASALKMCYAAYSKGSTALLAATIATAEALGVRENLYEQWDLDTAGFAEQVNQRITRVVKKAWRFEAEMLEIAATFQGAGLPGEFHEAAAEIYQRINHLRNKSVSTEIDEIAAAISNRRA